MSARRRETDADSSVGARGCFAEPERNARRLALRILDAHPARFDAQDAVRRVAELEDVALQALDGEILVERADERAGGLEDDLVVRVVGNGAAAGDRGQARALARAQPLVHGVAVQIGAASAAPRAEAFGEHAHDGVEVRAREIAIRPRARTSANSSSSPYSRADDLGDDLLREHVERMLGNAAAGRARRAARRRAARRIRPARRGSTGTAAPSARRSPSGWRGRRAAGTPRSMRGEPSWQTSSTSPMSMPSSSEAVATMALSLPALSRCSASKPLLLREAAVMGRDVLRRRAARRGAA